MADIVRPMLKRRRGRYRYFNWEHNDFNGYIFSTNKFNNFLDYMRKSGLDNQKPKVTL